MLSSAHDSWMGGEELTPRLSGPSRSHGGFFSGILDSGDELEEGSRAGVPTGTWSEKRTPQPFGDLRYVCL